MKRKTLLLMLLMALGAPWGAMAQTSYTCGVIGTGSGSSYYPLPGYYGYQYDVYLYDAEEINVTGTIRSIAWYVTSQTANENYTCGFTVWMKDVDPSFTLSKETMFSEFISGATQVYSTDNYTSNDVTVSEWNKFSFSNNFSHTQGKALLVCVKGNSNNSNGGCSKKVQSSTVDNHHWYKHQDTGTDPGNDVNAAFGNNAGMDGTRSNIKLNIGGQSFTTSSGTFYDSGGASGEYDRYEDYVYTFYPASSSDKVKLDFSLFITEGNNYDYMYVYDGANTSASQLAYYNSSSSGTNMAPLSVTATNSSGALTVKWYSDSSNQYAGFAATISNEASYPTTIASVEDWDAFCATVNGGYSYSNETVTMTDNVGTVSTMCGTSSDTPFSGTFDGGGYTLTVGITDNSTEGQAPFQYISGATIENLKVTGTVSSAAHHASGLVGFTSGGPNTIENCCVSTSVNCTATHAGGIIGHGKTAYNTIKGCVFDGYISVEGNTWAMFIGGLIGWSENAKATLENSLFAGTYNTNAHNFHPIGCKNVDATSFSATITNCYYTKDIYSDDSGFGTDFMNNNSQYCIPCGSSNKGKFAYTVTYDTERNVTVAMNGTSTNYNVSGITAYSDNMGLVYNGTIIAGSGDQVSLTLTGGGGANLNRFYATPTGTNLNTSTGNLTMPAANVWITNARRFAFGGSWDYEFNWSPNGVPQPDEDVIIEKNVYITNNCVAKIHNIEISGSGSITINDDGQLQHCNEGVVATMGKSIEGYGASTGRDHFYMMALPFTSFAIAGSPLVTSGAYDLYKFDGLQPQEEWVNYEQSNTQPPFTTIQNGEGFLYANANNSNPLMYLTGTLVPSDQPKSFPLVYNTNTPFGAWNLVGNPFACNASVSGVDFYVINGDEVKAATNNVVAPMQGIFAQATTSGQSATFSRATENSSNNTTSSVNLILKPADTRDAKVIDVARVRFNEGEGLEKFQLNPSHTKIYIPQNGMDYAVVHTQAEGELPVNFKAENNGRYTLSVDIEKVSFDYLHLIDNMTGADVDLLATPTYTFNARTTDYASRFKLVFAATGIEEHIATETFAYYNGSEWNIANDGDATLQVIDMMGRILSSETISGSCSKAINVATGVYMLRLINGNDVKVQKIVVR